MELKLDNGSWNTITGATDSLTSLADGSHTVTVRVTDDAGNVNSASASFVVDTVAPVLSINSPTSGSYNNTGSVTASWTTMDGGSGIAKTEIQLDTGAWATISGTSHSLNSLANGAHTMTIRATDNAGNMNATSVTFTVDTVKPVLNIVAPIPDSWYNTSELNATWTGTDSGSGIAYFLVSLDNGQWINGTNEYQMLSGLTNGQHTIEVRAYDKAGNHNDTALPFNVDTIKPMLTIATPIENARLNLSAVDVSWSANSASGIANYWVSIDSGVWTDVTKNTSYSFASLADGSHVVTLRAENNVGDYNETSVSFVIDTAAPTVTEHSSDGGNMPCSATTWASFSEIMNTSSVRVSVNGVNGTLTWNGNNVTFSPIAKMAYDTTYHVTVAGKDLTGNVVEYSWSFTTMKNEGVIEGVIKDANGNPIVDSTVTLSNGMTTTTDADGRFSFDSVPSGNYTLNATKPGLEPISQSVSASAGQTNELAALSAIASPSGTSDNSFLIGAGAILFVALLVLFLLFIRRRKKRE
jgi:LPXTG-motif cell wall-anchored protein